MPQVNSTKKKTAAGLIGRLIRRASALPKGDGERRAILEFVAGCEKLPEGGMRENCEKKKDEGGGKKAGLEGAPPIPSNLKSISPGDFKDLYEEAEDFWKDENYSNAAHELIRPIYEEDSRRRAVAEKAREEAQIATVLKVLGHGFPKAEKILLSTDEDSIYHPKSLSRMTPRSMKPYLEAMVVHDLLNRLGPDMNYDVLVRRLPAIRKGLPDQTILEAHEKDRQALAEAMMGAGLLGPKSDRLRAPADRYW